MHASMLFTSMYPVKLKANGTVLLGPSTGISMKAGANVAHELLAEPELTSTEGLRVPAWEAVVGSEFVIVPVISMLYVPVSLNRSPALGVAPFRAHSVMTAVPSD